MGRHKKFKTEDQYKTSFYQHVDLAGPDDCWLWTGGKNNIGYGLFRYEYKMQTVHRVQMQFLGHNITNRYVLHTCRNYLCVNPKHLLVGDMEDKVKLVIAKGSQKVPRGPLPKSTCKYCGTHTFVNSIGRFHNEKCKHKPTV